MAAKLALPLLDVLIAGATLGAGAGLSAEADAQNDILNDKTKTLITDTNNATYFYDHTYYLVCVNLERVGKSIDTLPTDFLTQVQNDINSDLDPTAAEKALATLGAVLGYSQMGIGAAALAADFVNYLRVKNSEKEAKANLEDPGFDYVPLDGEEVPTVSASKSSFNARTAQIETLATGLNYVGVVFGVASLGLTIGMGLDSINKIKDAIREVEKKQKQVTAFQDAMTKAMDIIVTAAGLPEKSYDQLVTMASTWEQISTNFDSYQTALNTAIQGYYKKVSLDDIKARMATLTLTKPFPEDGYPLAETLAEGIRTCYEVDKMNSQEIVAYFATDNPELGLRFVLNQTFVEDLINPW